MKDEAKKNQIKMQGMFKAFPKGTAEKVAALSNEGYNLHKSISMAVLNSKPTNKKSK